MRVFVYPIRDPRIIKREWLEELYPQADMRRTFEILNYVCQNPRGLCLGIFEETKKEIKGFLWGDWNELDGSMFVNSIYVAKECRRNPKLVGTFLDYLKENFLQLGYTRLIFLTKKPKFFLKRGCKLFEETCVVYEEEDGQRIHQDLKQDEHPDQEVLDGEGLLCLSAV